MSAQNFTVRQLIEGAWCAGYYDAGYTHDSGYAFAAAEKHADGALVLLPALRKAFEAWAIEDWYEDAFTQLEDGRYSEPGVERQWRAWQASAKRSHYLYCEPIPPEALSTVPMDKQLTRAYEEGRRDEREEIEKAIAACGFKLVVAPSGHQFLLNVQDDEGSAT